MLQTKRVKAPIESPQINPAPLKQRDPSGAQSALVLIAGGILFGVSHLDPHYWPLAWLGLILTAWGMQFSSQRLWPSIGLLFGGVFGHWLGHPWYYDATFYWGGGKWSALETTTVWFLATLLPLVLPERLMLLLLQQWPGRLRFPIWLWFPLAWFGGEQINFHFATLMQGSFIYTQWQAPPVLKALGHFGWTVTTLLCVSLCALAAESLFHRRWGVFVGACLSPVLLLLLPALSTDTSALKGVGAVHMANYQEAPVWSPKGTKLMIWPEVIRRGRPRLAEGPVTGLKMEPPLKSAQTYHLFGQETRTEAGFHNALLTMTPKGEVQSSRAKRLLFKLAEQKLFGWILPGRLAYEPGRHSTRLDVNGLPVAALLCLEAFNSRLALEGKRDGVQLITLSAIDHDMRNSAVAVRQLMGVTVLLAVETGLPAVRSSLFGVSALIAPDGRVIQASQPGQSGVLTLEGDWPAHIRRPVTPSRQSHRPQNLIESGKTPPL